MLTLTKSLANRLITILPQSLYKQLLLQSEQQSQILKDSEIVLQQGFFWRISEVRCESCVC